MSVPLIRAQPLARGLHSSTIPVSRSYATRTRTDHQTIPPSLVYRRVRRGHSLLMTGFAGTQGLFWGYTAYLSSLVPDPLLSTGWTVAGLGLSTAFAAMVQTYLKRSVAEISIVHGASDRVRVVTNAMGGRLSEAVLLDPGKISGGPKKDDPKERYWTFAVKNEAATWKFHYIVDTAHGVKDSKALASIACGGEHFLALAQKRRAKEMRDRWHKWETENGGRNEDDDDNNNNKASQSAT